MSRVHEDRLERVIIASCTSTSGKYRLILGQHIVAGRFCWDVGAINTHNGESTWRHYRMAIEDGANKAAAYAYYDEMKGKLTKPLKRREDDEPQPRYRITKLD